MGAFDYFVAELRCPKCDSVSDRDGSTNIQTKIRPEPDLSLLGVGDEVVVSPELLHDANYLAIPPPRGSYRLLQCWECPMCGDTNWARIVIEAGRIADIADVSMCLEAFESADYVHDGDLVFLHPRNAGPGDPVELARSELASPSQDDDADDESDDYEPHSLRIARELLGVEAAASPTSVKRAYLRQVKQHRPERDPEGFQRVREAYERVRGEPANPRGRVPSRLTGAEQRPASAPPAPAAAQNPLNPFFARAGKAKRGDPEVVEIWREAVAALPENAAARQELYGALMSQEQHEAGAEVLIDAIRAGHVGFLRHLMTAHTERAPDDLIERARADPALRHRVLRARVLGADWKRAATVALDALEAATKTTDESVSLDDCLTTLFGLAAGGARGLVRELAERIRAYVEHAPRELRASGLTAHWALAYELAESSRWMPRDVYETMGRALLDEDVGSGREALAKMPDPSGKKTQAIARRAPLLAALFDLKPPAPEEPALVPEEEVEEPPPEPHTNIPASTWIVSLSLALTIGILLAIRLDREPRTHSSPNDPFPVTPRATEKPNDEDAAPIRMGDGSLSKLETAAAALIEYAESEKRMAVVQSARRLVKAAERHDCDGVWDAIRALIRVEDPTQPGHDARLMGLLLDLTDEGRAVCRSNRVEP